MKSPGAQGARGKAEEKGPGELYRPALLAFGEPKAKEKASGLQRTGGNAEEKIRRGR